MEPMANREDLSEKPGNEPQGGLPWHDGFVVWSYGSGMCGTGDRQLHGPHMAEENPFNPDEIVVAEHYGCAILIVNRKSGKVQVLYGERGVSGSDRRLNAPHSAHFMPAGPYQGQVLITELRGEHRVLIVSKDDGKVLWRCTELRKPLEAIYWDDEHVMVSGLEKGISKIRLSDNSVVWQYDPSPRGIPFRLKRVFPEWCQSYGGDLLIGYWGPNCVVREINTSDKTTVWEYGRHKEHGHGDVYDKLYTPVCGLRYGQSEVGGGLTIICDERARILCVNSQKELVWELGGSSAETLAPATQYLLLPTYVSATSRGTLLITDWGRNMIYEISPFRIPERKHKDAYLFRDYETTDAYEDSAIMEARGYLNKNIQVFNTHPASSLQWRVLASHNAQDWQIIHEPAEELQSGRSVYFVIKDPWNFIKTQARSAHSGKSARVTVFISMLR
jgi:hypothetical protein